VRRLVVTDANAEFPAVQKMHSTAMLVSEAGKPAVVLPAFKFRAGGNVVEMTLLLVPFEHSGYATRLFFERKLEGAGQSTNWTEHTVVSRKWWAPSWKDVAPDLPWISMLGAHLRAVT
jgi:hypothetical protein